MERVPGNLQRIVNGKRRYAITPLIPGGFVQPDMLIKFAEVAKKFDAVLKITGGQRIMITNLKKEDLTAAWEMLGMEPAYTTSNVVRSVKICPGTTFCKRAKQDSIHLGMVLNKKYISKEMPSKVKIGVSGCPNSCSEAITKDFGVIGTDEGWKIYAGGSAGAHPRFADFITFVSTEAEVLAIFDKMINYYRENAIIERVGEFIERIGINNFKKAVLGDNFAEDTEVINKPVVEIEVKERIAKLAIGEKITPDSIIRDIIDIYPATIPVLQSIGMGCLGCPSSTNEPLSQAAQIHGVDITELVDKLNAVCTS